MNQLNYKLLVADDDDDIRYAVASILEKCGCTVIEARSIEDSIKELELDSYDAIFCDMRFGYEVPGGEELLSHTLQYFPDTAVVLMSCSMDSRQRSELVAKGAFDCLQKPFFREKCLTVLGKLEKMK